MDIRGPSIQSALAAVPLAPSTIVFDRFQVMQRMTEAVGVVRRRANRLLIVESLDNKSMAIKPRAGAAATLRASRTSTISTAVIYGSIHKGLGIHEDPGRTSDHKPHSVSCLVTNSRPTL